MRRTTPRRGLGAAALLLLTPLGCSNDDADLLQEFAVPLPGTQVSLRDSVQPVFDANCAVPGCHSGMFPEQGMSLESGMLFDPVLGAVGVPSMEAPGLNRIQPGSAEMSYLVNKIEGTQAAVGGQGERMPFACIDDPGNCDQPAFCLCDQTIQGIRDWIDQGAQDN